MAMASADKADEAQSLARLTLIIFLPFASGYFLSYLLRTVNAVIAPNLIEDLSLSAQDLGLLTAAYFLAFAGFQLPLGLLLDRFGPRRVEAVLLLFAGAGCLLFAASESTLSLFLGRGLIGLGVSACLMAALKAIVLWYPPQKWPLMNGLFMMTGGLGALSATAPVEALLPILGWRGFFYLLSVGVVLSSGLIFFAVPERQVRSQGESLLIQLKGLRVIFSDRVFWRIAPLAVITVAASLAIQSLWAGPWLRDVANLDRIAVAHHLFILALFLTLGFGFGGFLTERLARLGIPQGRILGTNSVLFGLTLAALAMGSGANGGIQGYAIWAAFGFFSNTSVNAFAMLAQHFPRTYSGRASTALNMLMFTGAFGAQYLIGVILDLWPRTAVGGYNPTAYAVSFGGCAVVTALAFLWYLKDPQDKQRQPE